MSRPSAVRVPGVGQHGDATWQARQVAMWTAVLLLLGSALLIAVLLGDLQAPAPARHAGDAVGFKQVLSGSADGFERALRPRPFELPEDHGAHPRFRAEWWYLTGNLSAATDPSSAVAAPAAQPVPGNGRAAEFGFQVTFFRFALAPTMPAAARSENESPGDASAWATRQVYMAHVAISDLTEGRFHRGQRLQREVLGLAGARAGPFEVWLRDWSLRGPGQSAPASLAGGRDGLFPLQVRFDAGPMRAQLRVEAGKPMVLQGRSGLSAKSDAPGNASYYYSYTRLPVTGRIETDTRRWRVRGSAWLDREWSTSALAGHQTGWDWFALQLSDGRDLMFYRIRERAEDGGRDGQHPERTARVSAGVLVEADGRYRIVPADAVVLRAERHWTSPASGVRYPIEWSLALDMPAGEATGRRTELAGDGPRAGRVVEKRVPVGPVSLALRIRARLAAQEQGGDFRYWEGSVAVRGRSLAGPVTGLGYLEMAGR